MDTTGKGLLGRIATWATAPITAPFDPVDVILGAILVTTVVVAWLFVLNHIIPGKE